MDLDREVRLNVGGSRQKSRLGHPEGKTITQAANGDQQIIREWNLKRIIRE
jgi:hypothetical protein